MKFVSNTPPFLIGEDPNQKKREEQKYLDDKATEYGNEIFNRVLIMIGLPVFLWLTLETFFK